MMDEPRPAVVEDLNETHTESAYESAVNTNHPHTTGVESKITGVDNEV